MASLLAMFAIVVVVTLANYVVPIVIVGGVVWVVLLVSLLRGRRAASAAPGDVSHPRLSAGPSRPRPVELGLCASSVRRLGWHRSAPGLSR